MDISKKKYSASLLHEIEECLESFNQEMAKLVAARTEGMPAKIYKERMKELKTGRATTKFLREAAIEDMRKK